jgi:hypothetical protein
MSLPAFLFYLFTASLLTLAYGMGQRDASLN